MLALMGAGAITTTAFLPQWRRRHLRDGFVLRGSALQAVVMAVIALTDPV